MRFQPGHSGNPAGRPQGSLNKKTLALEEAFAEHADEILKDVVERAKSGDRHAQRLCMERMLAKRQRPVPIELPVIKTPEDAEAALAVVTAELAAGKLSISEASSLVALIDRMLRVAERMWNFARARRYGARHDAVMLDDDYGSAERRESAETDDPEEEETAEEPAAPLYSPVNSQFSADAVAGEAAGGGEPAGSGVPRAEASPLPRAA